MIDVYKPFREVMATLCKSTKNLILSLTPFLLASLTSLAYHAIAWRGDDEYTLYGRSTKPYSPEISYIS
jgi:hypothetical protein